MVNGRGQARRSSNRVIRAVVETLEQRQLLAGIQLAAELYPGVNFGEISDVVEFNGKLYVDSWSNLFATGGTQATTSLVKEFTGLTDELISTSAHLYIRNGSALWASDGTLAGTVNITPASLAADSGFHFAFASRLFFGGKSAESSTVTTPWISDGTSAGTRELTSAPLVTSIDPVIMNGQLFFIAGTSNAYKVYRSDGTPGGTQAIFDIPTLFATDLAAAGDTLVLSLPNEQWSLTAQGAATQISSVFDASDLTSWNGVVYYNGNRGGIGSEGWELWRSDGTAAGTFILKDIYAGSLSSHPRYFAPAETRLYFVASTAAQGAEWWLTDGTPQGTRLAGELFPGTGGLNTSSVAANQYAVVGDTVFFANSVDGFGPELCQTDGTQAGTRMVENLRGTGSEQWIGSWPSTITAAGPAIYFQATSDTVSSELFKYSPSDEGTLIGTIFADANHNGVRNATEMGIAAVSVYVDANNNSILDAGEKTATTDANGLFRLLVPAGTRVIRALAPSGMGQSVPSTTQASTYTIAAGEIRGGALFGLYVNTSPTVTVPSTFIVNEGQSTTLVPTAFDAESAIALYEWDLDYVGTFDVTHAVQTPSFSAATIDGPATRLVAVRVTDAAGATSDIALSTVHIVNVNPTAKLTVPANVAIGASATITLSQPLDLSPADSANLCYSYDFDDDGVFEVVDSLVPSATVPSSYLSSTGSHKVRAKVSDDDGGFTTLVGTIQVWDLGLSTSTIAEGAAADSQVGLLSVIGASGGTFAYSLVAGEGSIDNDAMRLQGSQLRIRATPDFEAKSNYSIRIRATGGGITLEKSFTILVSNVNERPTDIQLSHANVAENTAKSMAIGTFTGIDPDAGDLFSFSLIAGDGDSDNALFEIVGRDLRARQSLDFEQRSSYSIRVRVTDAGGLTADKAFAISVSNVNERPTAITLSKSTIAEGLSSGSAVGTFSATDPDTGDTRTFSLVSGSGAADNALFQIVSGVLKTRASFDYETRSSYSIRVRATDAGGLSFDKAFIVLVTNVAETPLVVDGTAGNDTISLSMVGSKLRATRNGAVVSDRELALVGSIRVNGLAGHDRVTLTSGLTIGALIYGNEGNDTLTGGSGADTIYGNFGDDVIIGGAGSDSIMGGIGADSISGNAGNDSIWGGDQSDTIHGGDGDDYIEGKGKADTLYGDAGNDTILGQAGSDLIYGGEGNDSIDIYDGPVFRDTVYAGAGSDTVKRDLLDAISEAEVLA